MYGQWTALLSCEQVFTSNWNKWKTKIFGLTLLVQATALTRGNQDVQLSIFSDSDDKGEDFIPFNSCAW